MEFRQLTVHRVVHVLEEVNEPWWMNLFCGRPLRAEWRLWSGLIHGGHSGFQLWQVTVKILCKRHKSRPTTAISLCEGGLLHSAASQCDREQTAWNSENKFWQSIYPLEVIFSDVCVWVCVWLYLFQVQSDSHIVILHPILDRRTLPPLVCPVYSIFYGMSFCETNTKRDTSYSVEIYLAPQPCRFPKEKNVPLCFFFV